MGAIRPHIGEDPGVRDTSDPGRCLLGSGPVETHESFVQDL